MSYREDYEDGVVAALEDWALFGEEHVRKNLAGMSEDALDPGFFHGYKSGARKAYEDQYPALTEPHHPRDDADDTDRGV